MTKIDTTILKLFLGSCSLLAILFTQVSCDKGGGKDILDTNWLVGTWIVDREVTTKTFVDGVVEKIGIDGGDNLKDKILVAAGKKTASATASATVAAVIKPLDKFEFTFTETEYSKQAVGFGGEGVPYTITSRPARNQITISEGGDSRTYTKDKNLIWYSQSIPGGNIKIFLKKKDS